MGAEFKRMETGILQFELEIEIDASPDQTWQALTNELPTWWLPDFHVLGPDSTLTFEPVAGKPLIESKPDGSSLMWFNVHWIQPADRTIALIGHSAPDWGGPAIEMLKLVVAERGGGSVLQVRQTIQGNIDEKKLNSQHDGWQQLFGDGLKRYVESK